jgi:hypothetical protein
VEPTLAFISPDRDQPGLEIRVNFGVFAGREATAAEIDDLARTLLQEVADVSIVSEQRHEIGDGVEAAVHQVRVEVAEGDLPGAGPEREALEGKLVEASSAWAAACIAERHVEIGEP